MLRLRIGDTSQLLLTSLVLISLLSSANLITIDGVSKDDFDALLTSGLCDTSEIQVGLCQDRLDSNNTVFRDCSCNETCWEYGECCMNNLRKITPIWKCKSSFSDGTPFYTLATCRSDWPDDDVRSACENSDEDGLDYKSIPVYSSKRNLYYANIYCAVCNRDFSVENLRHEVKCFPDEMDDTSKIPISYNITTNRYFVKSNNGMVQYCNVKAPKLPEDIEPTWINTRKQCELVISSCPAGWKDTNVAILCRSYLHKLIKFSRFQVFRNYHCALCNGVPLDELYCGSYGLGGGGPSRSLSVLLDFKVRSVNSDHPKNSCGPGEYFDRVLKTCFSVSCPSGKVWETNKCV